MVRASLRTRWKARRELQSLHRRAQERLRRWLDLAIRAYFGRTHLGVTGHSWRRGEATRLDRPRRPHALAHRRRAFGLVAIRQLLVVYTRRLDMDINAIQQRATDALLVARDDAG
jgi:hypothetical protein